MSWWDAGVSAWLVTETAQAREDAHRAFDKLWHGHGRRARARCYVWLADQLGVLEPKAHMGNMDHVTCVRVIEICSNASYVDVLLELAE